MFQHYQINTFGIKNLEKGQTGSNLLSPKHLRVKIHAVSLNYRDLLMIKGLYNPRMKLPVIPLSDGAGEVIEIGSEITNFKVGDRVCTTMIPDWECGTPIASIHKTTLGGPADGCLTHGRDFRPNELIKIPASMSFEQASTLPVAGLTAWNALQTIASKKKATVLLLGTGGVSLSALSIAKSLGHTTIITSSSDQKLTLAKSLGADHTINYINHPNWGKLARKFSSSGCDLVVEVGGQGTFNQSVQALGFGGSLALIGVLAKNEQAVDLTRILMSKIDIRGILVGSRQDFENYLKFIAETDTFPHIGHRFNGIQEIFSALELMESGNHFGKIVIRV